jgi:hypothetical protein
VATTGLAKVAFQKINPGILQAHEGDHKMGSKKFSGAKTLINEHKIEIIKCGGKKSFVLLKHCYI